MRGQQKTDSSQLQDMRRTQPIMACSDQAVGVEKACKREAASHTRGAKAQFQGWHAGKAGKEGRDGFNIAANTPNIK